MTGHHRKHAIRVLNGPAPGAARPPFERVLAGADLRPKVVAQLHRYREGFDPFALARAIDRQLERIHALASLRHGTPVDPAPVRRPVRNRLSIKPSPHLVARPARSVTSEPAR